MQKRLVAGLVTVALVAAACAGSDDATPPASAPPTTATSTTTVPPPNDTTTTPADEPVASDPLMVPTLDVTGPAEVVFDWDLDACEPEHIPDIAARAFRSADGRVQLSIGHYVNYRMVGPSLDDLTTDCAGPTLVSSFDPDPSMFDDSSWIGGVHTVDGETIHAIVHNEYRGDTHGTVRPDQCPSGRRFTCLDTSVTLFVSRDGGDSFEPIAEPPGHMVATLPYVFDDEGVPSGLRQPSNIIDGRDGYFYVFTNVSDYPVEAQWVCAMRTDDLDDPAAWRFWDGEGFAGVFVNPYLTPVDDDTEKCAPLARPQLGVGVQESVLYDEALGAFVMFGTEFAPGTATQAGIYYSTSPDLIEWSSRRLLLELSSYAAVDDFDNDVFHAYVSVLDTDSDSSSFDSSDGTAHLYVTRFNAGTSSLDRDLLRWPISLSMTEAVAPAWEFETGGDEDGGDEAWTPFVDVGPLSVADGTLSFETTGDDPHFGTSLAAAAGFDRLVVRMRVDGTRGDDQAQVFFGTDTVPEFSEAASALFPIVVDGEFHEYEIDMGAVDGWDGTIVTLRLDPGSRAGQEVDIDWIRLTPG